MTEAMTWRALVAVLSAWVVACGAGRVPAWERPQIPGPRRDVTALLLEGDERFSRRESKKHLRAAIKSWELAARAQPENATTWLNLARAYHLLADGFLAHDAESKDVVMEEMLAAYEQGATAAERALCILAPSLATKLRAGARLREVVELAQAPAVPALYWYGISLARWAHGNGVGTESHHRPTLLAIMGRIIALDRAYWYGGADRFLGVLYADLSSVRGGDVEKARVHFEKALAIAPAYVGTLVLQAEFYWGKRVRNRQRYRETLKMAATSPANSLVDLEPEQRLERKRAAALLKKCDELLF